MVNTDSLDLEGVYGDDPDRFNNIWTVRDGDWQDKASARSFFSKYFTFGRTHKSKQLFRNSNHIVMSLPSVAACNLAVKLFTEMNLPWSPMSIVGDSGNDQESILEHVRSNDQTICFTRWANVVGVTVPEWDTVVHGAKTDSAEFYIQFSFRGGSTRKESWNVIDFNSEQTLGSILELVQATNDAEGGSEPSNLLKTFLDFADVHEFEDGFQKVDYSRFLKLSCSNATDSITLLNRKATKLSKQGKVSEVLSELTSNSWNSCRRSTQVGFARVNSNGTNNEGSLRYGERKIPPSRESQVILQKITGALHSIPSLLAFHSTNKPISTYSQVMLSPNLEVFTGLNREGFELASDLGWFSKVEVSKFISNASLVIQSVSNS